MLTVLQIGYVASKKVEQINHRYSEANIAGECRAVMLPWFAIWSPNKLSDYLQVRQSLNMQV
jgi:hypothetical protein